MRRDTTRRRTFALYWVLFIVQPQVYRVSFLLVALVLTFLLFPRRRGDLSGVSPLDWALIALTIVALSWPLVDFSTFVYRAADPKTIDLVLGAVTVLLVLEATRRSVGAILPVTALVFLLYAYAGPRFDDIGLPLLAHRGYDIDRLIGTLYITLEGILGSGPLRPASADGSCARLLPRSARRWSSAVSSCSTQRGGRMWPAWRLRPWC